MNQLKPITFKAIYEAQEDKNCQEFWDEFMELQKETTDDDYGLVCDPYAGKEIPYSWLERRFLPKHPKAKQWLIEHGFIASEYERTYEIGDIIDEYKICQIGFRKLMLIGDDGNRKDDITVKVDNILKITKEEVNRLLGKI